MATSGGGGAPATAATGGGGTGSGGSGGGDARVSRGLAGGSGWAAGLGLPAYKGRPGQSPRRTRPGRSVSFLLKKHVAEKQSKEILNGLQKS